MLRHLGILASAFHPLRILIVQPMMSTMPRDAILAICPFIAACTNQEQIDCTSIDLPTIERCHQKNQGKGEVAALVACLPFSPPLKTSGVWVVGFEKNDFFEGRPSPPPNVIWTDSTGAELLVDEKIFKPRNDTEALQVELVGRRALCPLGVINPYPIAVEKLQITKRMGAR